MSNLAHTVKRSILLPAAPERVWEALTGEVELVEEAERLSFRWWREGCGPSRVELVLDAVAEGTRLTVVESSLIPAATPLLASSWARPLARLRLAVGLVAA